MNEDEKKYEDVIKSLKSLQRVKAHPNFEADLKRRLNAEKYAKEKRTGIRRFLMPSRLVPSFGLAVAAILVFMIVNTNSDEADNPFFMEPRVREDMISISESEIVELPENIPPAETDDISGDGMEEETDRGNGMERMMEDRSMDENLIAGREFSTAETTMTDETGSVETEEFTSPPATGFAIRKSALNFRQVNITAEQQNEIIELKKKISKEKDEADIK